VLVAAAVVLIAGIAAVALHDEKRSPARSTMPSSSLPPTTASPTTAGSAGSTTTSAAPTTATSVATTVRPPVTSPEAAVNGLWAAYAANNQVAAQRFASDDVIRVLFVSPYNGEQGSFQGCRPNTDVFECDELQPSTRYAMTVGADAANGYRVVELTVAPR
jgi:hypothetical protein